MTKASFVKSEKTKPGLGAPECLISKLEEHFSTPMGELPPLIRQRIEEEFIPMDWDQLTADQRRAVAHQLDARSDPDLERERLSSWDHFLEIDKLERQLAEWEAVACPTARDLELRDAQVAQLSKELAFLRSLHRPVEESPERRLERICREVADAKSRGLRNFNKVVAAANGITTSRVKQMVKKCEEKRQAKQINKPKQVLEDPGARAFGQMASPVPSRQKTKRRQ